MLRTYHPLQKSSSNWYLVSVLMRRDPAELAPSDYANHEPLTLWENRVLIQATTPKEALQKARDNVRIEERTYRSEGGAELRNSFHGFTHMVPVHNPLEDGVEIEWLDRTGMKPEAIAEYTAGNDVESAWAFFDRISEDQQEDFPRTPQW